MQGARTVARSSCTVQAGDCRLPWMNVTRLRISVSCRMCLGALEQLQSRCFGSPLCTFLWTSRKRTTRRDPSRSTPRGVRRGSGRSRRRFLQARHHRDLHTRIITHFHQGLAPPTTGGVAVEHPGPCSRRRPLSRGLTHQKIPPS